MNHKTKFEKILLAFREMETIVCVTYDPNSEHDRSTYDPKRVNHKDIASNMPDHHMEFINLAEITINKKKSTWLCSENSRNR